MLFGNGGGTSVLATDYFARLGLDVPAFDDETVALLDALKLPPGTSLTNPVDCPVGTLQQEEGRVAEKILDLIYSRGRPGALVDETALAALVQFTRNLAGKSLAIEETCFVNPEPCELRAYREFFGGAVRFGQPASRLRFPASYLALPLRQPDASLLAMLEAQAQSLLAELPREGGFEHSVRSSIARLLRERYGYKGELRAVGEVLRDNLFYHSRCGFDSFLVSDQSRLDDALEGLGDFSDGYQASADRPQPLFRRRAA